MNEYIHNEVICARNSEHQIEIFMENIFIQTLFKMNYEKNIYVKETTQSFESIQNSI